MATIETTTLWPESVGIDLAIESTEDGGATVLLSTGETLRVSPPRTCGETEHGYRQVINVDRPSNYPRKSVRILGDTGRRYAPPPTIVEAVAGWLES